jgi:hypothetical protein
MEYFSEIDSKYYCIYFHPFNPLISLFSSKSPLLKRRLFKRKTKISLTTTGNLKRNPLFEFYIVFLIILSQKNKKNLINKYLNIKYKDLFVRRKELISTVNHKTIQKKMIYLNNPF